jgi:hypothetical protein
MERIIMTCGVCSTEIGYIDVEVVTPNLFRTYICGTCNNLVPDIDSVIEPIPDPEPIILEEPINPE